jgi:hypothetical protein
MNEKADAINKKYLYRRLILTKKIKLAHHAAVKLIGPDTAYHLYSQKETAKPSKKKTRNKIDEPLK